MEQVSTLADVQLLDSLETKLGHLAARWRGAENQQSEAGIVQQYQAVLRCMIELGFTESLDVDAELPDEYMPREYLTLHR